MDSDEDDRIIQLKEYNKELNDKFIQLNKKYSEVMDQLKILHQLLELRDLELKLIRNC